MRSFTTCRMSRLQLIASIPQNGKTMKQNTDTIETNNKYRKIICLSKSETSKKVQCCLSRMDYWINAQRLEKCPSGYKLKEYTYSNYRTLEHDNLVYLCHFNHYFCRENHMFKISFIHRILFIKLAPRITNVFKVKRQWNK